MNENEVNISTPFDESATLSEVVTNVRTTLHSAIESRKQIDRDAQLLLNRIQLLKNEEAKAMKNIAITKARAMNVRAVKREAAIRNAERYEVERRRQMELLSTHERNLYLRESSRANRVVSLKEAHQSKIQAAYETRATIRSSALQRLQEMEKEKIIASRRTELIRQERIQAKQRLATEKVQRLRRFQLEYESRLAHEEELKQQSESFLAQLEKEELELIRRLQRVQKEQSLVYEELTPSLPPSTPPHPTTKSTPALSISSRTSPPISSSRVVPRNHHAPTVASLSRRDLGGAAMR